MHTNVVVQMFCSCVVENFIPEELLDELKDCLQKQRKYYP